MEYLKGVSHVETRKINWRLSHLDLNKQEEKGEIFGVKTFFQGELVKRRRQTDHTRLNASPLTLAPHSPDQLPLPLSSPGNGGGWPGGLLESSPGQLHQGVKPCTCWTTMMTYADKKNTSKTQAV